MAILTIISFPKKISLKERFKSTEIITSRMLSGSILQITGFRHSELDDRRVLGDSELPNL